MTALMYSRVPGWEIVGSHHVSSVHLCGSQIRGVPLHVSVVKKKSTRGSRERRNITPAGVMRWPG